MFRTSLAICSGMTFICVIHANNPRFEHGPVFDTLEEAEAAAEATHYRILFGITRDI